jgi:phenylacetate-CoA ligase
MSAWATYRAYRRQLRTQWLEPDGLRRLQESSLRRLVDHAVSTVPYYRQLFKQAGLEPEDVRTLDDLQHIPLTKKSTLQSLDLKEMTSSSYAPDQLVSERTSGSSGRPFELHFDREFGAFRNALFMRALSVAGYRCGRPALILAAGSRSSRRLLRWRYAPVDAPPEHLVDALNAHRPWLLYGPVTPLRQMALHIQDTSTRVHTPVAVAATAEALDGASRRLFTEVFGAQVFDLYGLTETGMLAWECPQHDGLHLSEDAMIVEMKPDEHSQDARLVVTNLLLRGMPLIRYDTGDLARPKVSGPCPCGRHLQRVEAVSGRALDCMRLKSGQRLSPYQITLALESICGLRRYQVVQIGIGRFTIRYESADTVAAEVAETAKTALHGVLGHEALIDVRRERCLEPAPGRKFKVVECRIADGAGQ